MWDQRVKLAEFTHPPCPEFKKHRTRKERYLGQICISCVLPSVAALPWPCVRASVQNGCHFAEALHLPQYDLHELRRKNRSPSAKNGYLDPRETCQVTDISGKSWRVASWCDGIFHPNTISKISETKNILKCIKSVLLLEPITKVSNIWRKHWRGWKSIRTSSKHSSQISRRKSSLRIRPYKTYMDAFGSFLERIPWSFHQMNISRRCSESIVLSTKAWRVSLLEWIFPLLRSSCLTVLSYALTWPDDIDSSIPCSEGGDWSGWKGKQLDWTRNGMWNIACHFMVLIPMTRSIGQPARLAYMYSGQVHTTKTTTSQFHHGRKNMLQKRKKKCGSVLITFSAMQVHAIPASKDYLKSLGLGFRDIPWHQHWQVALLLKRNLGLEAVAVFAVDRGAPHLRLYSDEGYRLLCEDEPLEFFEGFNPVVWLWPISQKA